MAQHIITLAGDTDSPGFKREARALLAALVAPDDVRWAVDAAAASDRFTKAAGAAVRRAGATAGSTHPLVPRSFMSLCETVILHNASMRFGLLYRLLWRLVHEPHLQRNPLDDDRMQALHMAQAVRRDMQKMKTLAQFSLVDDPEGEEALNLCGFDPDHHIVEAMAPHFARRMAPQRWAILTPERSVRGHGQWLEFAPGVPDASEAAGLQAYRDVFATAPTPPFTAPRQAAVVRSDTGSAGERSSRPDSAS